MLRTIFTIGVFAILGLFVLRLAFGVLSGVLGLLLSLAWLAVEIAVVGLAIYIVIGVLSPSTARRMRQRFSGR